jgi:hypothetical protein
MEWAEPQCWGDPLSPRQIASAGEIAELAETATIAHYIGCMTTMYGLDNRRVTPPFVPDCRGEDSLFGALLNRIDPVACWGVIPHGVLHDRPHRRPARMKTGYSYSAVLSALFKALPRPRPDGSLEEAIRDAGHDLCRVARSDPRDVKAFVIEQLGSGLVTVLAEMERRAANASAGALRNQWAERRQEKLRVFEALCCSTETGGSQPPHEWAWSELPVRLHAYGQLLTLWPEIIDVSKQLHARGVRASMALAEVE